MTNTLSKINVHRDKANRQIDVAKLAIANYLQYTKTSEKDKYVADYNIGLWITVKERLDDLKQTLEKIEKLEAGIRPSFVEVGGD